jgi:hypothetical protein
MTRPSTSRRRTAAFIAAPIAAFIVAFGALTAALAYNGSTQSGCNDNHVCYYADINRAPNGQAHQVLNIGGIVKDWTNIPDNANPVVCGGVFSNTWNDCASSLWSRYSSTTEYAWTAHNCTGSRLVITAGRVLDYVGDTFNDKISSDRDGNGNSNC